MQNLKEEADILMQVIAAHRVSIFDIYVCVCVCYSLLCADCSFVQLTYLSLLCYLNSAYVYSPEIYGLQFNI